MELDKSLAVLAAFEKLYCLEQNLKESPQNKHPFLRATVQKNTKQKIEDRYRSQKENKNDLLKKIRKAERPPFFRRVLKKMEAEFPQMPDVQEWKEV